ncbi:hypothetical protein Tco_0024136 [Tanacetum coccineum]
MLLPTHIPKAIANYVRPRLNTSVLDSNETHTTNQSLYDTLYESIILDQEALNAQEAEPSFHKRTHDNQDPPNNHEGENKKKRRKDVGEPSSRSSRQNKSPMKSDIDQNENHILGPSTIAIAKKLKALIQKDELTIADLEGAGLERLKQQYQNDVELEYHVDQLNAVMLSEAKWNSDEDDVSKPIAFERHMSKNTKPHPSFYNNDFYYLVSLSTEEKYTTYITKHYPARYYIQDSRIDFFKAEMSTRIEGDVYSDLNELFFTDLPILSLNDVEDMYLRQVQDKLHHLLSEFVKDFNNALLLFIRRVMIQNRVKDIQLGVESYQQTLNLTKPMMLFEGIDQRIPFTITTTHKGVVYLNQHNVKSLMRLSEVKKFYDATLEKIQENLIDMMVKKIDQTLKCKEQLIRLEEYVGGRPKTVNPRTFVKPM